MDKLVRKQIFYQESCNERRQYESMLFQRLNYFIVAIAFLVAAFVQLALSRLIWLALFVGGFGAALSWLYTAINYHNARIMSKLVDDTANLEEKFFNDKNDLYIYELPYSRMKITLSENKFKFDWCTVLWDTIKDIKISGFNKQNTEGEVVLSPHTWMIPYSFVIFWLIALILYISLYLTPYYGLFLPMAFLVYVIGVPLVLPSEKYNEQIVSGQSRAQLMNVRNKIKVWDVFIDGIEMIIVAYFAVLTWTSSLPLLPRYSRSYWIVLGFTLAYLILLLIKYLRKYVFSD